VCLLGVYLLSRAKGINSSSVSNTYSLDVVEIFNRGLEYLKKGDYENAIKDFTRALKINPKYADAYNGRGAAYSAMGDKSER